MVKRHALFAAALAVTASAYQEFNMSVDDVLQTKFIKSQTWTTAEISNENKSVRIGNNNSLVFRNNADNALSSVFKPTLMGGAIEYTVDLSSNDCGCVTGLYAVEMTNQCNPETPTEFDSSQQAAGEAPKCAGIDIMQANKYGFQM